MLLTIQNASNHTKFIYLNNENPRTSQRTNMNALMVFTPIIMGGLNLKICQNFVGTKFFLTFVEGVKIIWG